MIDFYITNQSIRFASPVIAANSRDYLTASFHFSGEAWDGCSKWVHFRQDETVYDLSIEDDALTAESHLNLSIGQWEVYITGTKGDSRITTVPVYIQVMESGLIDEPLHQIPMSVAEQVDSKANVALEKAKALEEAINNGTLDGRDFQILGYYASLEQLMAQVTEPERGDVYGVGAEAPYDIYVYDGMNKLWVNNGSIQGAKGDKGDNGTTFTPQMDDNGNLSWSNDGGLKNPKTMNLIGSKGDKGDKGQDGESPYELAVKEGFSGTEATFNWALSHIAAHAGAHKASGTDPLIIDGDNIEAGSISREKLAEDVRVLCFTGVTVAVGKWAEDDIFPDYTYRAAIGCSGVTAKFFPTVVFDPADVLDGTLSPVAVSYSGGVYIYASEIPKESLTIPTIICTPLGQ
jgi:hypothetical protein